MTRNTITSESAASHLNSKPSQICRTRRPAPATRKGGRARALLLAAGAAGAATSVADAQPFNVRAWYAAGQVFVVWQMTAPPAVPTDTVEIYSSAAAQASTMNMDLEGRLFYPEYTGGRLALLAPAARLTVPTPGGGTYTLAIDEG